MIEFAERFHREMPAIADYPKESRESLIPEDIRHAPSPNFAAARPDVT